MTVLFGVLFFTTFLLTTIAVYGNGIVCPSTTTTLSKTTTTLFTEKEVSVMLSLIVPAITVCIPNDKINDIVQRINSSSVSVNNLNYDIEDLLFSLLTTQESQQEVLVYLKLQFTVQDLCDRYYFTHNNKRSIFQGQLYISLRDLLNRFLSPLLFIETLPPVHDSTPCTTPLLSSQSTTRQPTLRPSLSRPTTTTTTTTRPTTTTTLTYHHHHSSSSFRNSSKFVFLLIFIFVFLFFL